ncbi:hypothetical protein GUJ93_ZPchr0007g3254 [Zizania palustris]|uniref:Uncharacterized protein n=1 Tax=Zizania palustris TaxID=103762 RepID=A0A8J5TA06_ZIZPA|nr:hypothetical protein GUJ93_ZPchr0007g3254 [Zizania palustris]
MMPTPPPLPPPPVHVVSARTVKTSPRPRERIPLNSRDVAMLLVNYIQKGLLFTPPTSPPLLSTTDVVDHLAASLATALEAYYPVAGRFVTERHQQGCSISIDCDGQGVQIVHAVADGIAMHHRHVVNYDGHQVPLFIIQVTELNDGVFVGFVYNHALSDGTAFWDFINAWAQIARVRLAPPDQGAEALGSSWRPPFLKRWSLDGTPVVLPYADMSESEIIERLEPPLLCERMLHFSAESLVALKDLISLGGPQWQNAKNLALLSCRQGQFPPVCRLDLVPPGCCLDSIPSGGLRRCSVEAVAGSRHRHCFGLQLRHHYLELNPVAGSCSRHCSGLQIRHNYLELNTQGDFGVR